jgi:hypothetical protein
MTPRWHAGSHRYGECVGVPAGLIASLEKKISRPLVGAEQGVSRMVVPSGRGLCAAGH